ncbi:hypothetical protein E4T56_gene3942 [Termitomyces sp. T112]|nr:hypothetical protein E4T56_gene3942 [Termitomyces sp. T112]
MRYVTAPVLVQTFNTNSYDILKHPFRQRRPVCCVYQCTHWILEHARGVRSRFSPRILVNVFCQRSVRFS